MATKSKIIGLKDLRVNMESYIGQVKKGRSFTVVRRSQPVFKVMPVDEWGDEGIWETVLDLTKIKKNGVPIDEVIEAFKRVNAKDR